MKVIKIGFLPNLRTAPIFDIKINTQDTLGSRDGLRMLLEELAIRNI